MKAIREISKLSITCCYLASPFLGTVTAQTVIQWGPQSTSYLTGNAGAAATFEDTSALDLGSGFTFESGDYASAPTSSDFYAASRSFAGDGTTIETGSTIQLQNDSNITDGGDGVIFSNGRVQPDANFDGATNHAIAFWTVASQSGALDNLSYRAGRNAGSNSASRAVIRLGSDFYISEDLGELSFADDGLGDPTLELALRSLGGAPSSVNWFNYDPTTDFTVVGTAATISDFTGLTGAGFYGFNQDNGAEFRTIGLGEFTVTVVPEPSTGLLLGLAGIAVFWLRRKQ